MFRRNLFKFAALNSFKIVWVVSIVLFTCVIANAQITSSTVQALNCYDYNLSGVWRLKQDNGYTVHLNLKQERIGDPRLAKTSLSGTANYYRPGGSLNGKVSGTLNRTTLYMEITWAKGETGVYRGGISNVSLHDDAKEMRGDTFSKQHPKSTAHWKREEPIRCWESPGTRPY